MFSSRAVAFITVLVATLGNPGPGSSAEGPAKGPHAKPKRPVKVAERKNSVGKVLGHLVRFNVLEVEKMERRETCRSSRCKHETDTYRIELKDAPGKDPEYAIAFLLKTSQDANLDKFRWSQPAVKRGPEEVPKASHRDSHGAHCGQGVHRTQVSIVLGGKRELRTLDEGLAVIFDSKRLPNGTYIGSIKLSHAESKTAFHGAFPFRLKASG